MNGFGPVFWKEWREFLRQGGRSSLLRPAITLGFLGVVMPLESRDLWLAMPLELLLLQLWMPLLLVIGLVPDAFAGERERHTLETLLASSAGDMAIPAAKITWVVLFAMGLVTGSLALGAVSVNAATWTGATRFYPPWRLAALLVLAFELSLLTASMSAIASIRAPSVRQAMQNISTTLLVVTLATGFAFSRLPEEVTRDLAGRAAFAVVALLLAVANLVALALVRARFRRSRLITH